MREEPCGYSGLFIHSREPMAEVPAAHECGSVAGHLSLHVSASSGEGRCKVCQGEDRVKFEGTVGPMCMRPATADIKTRHRPHAFHLGRTNHRSALCRHRCAARSAAPANVITTAEWPIDMGPESAAPSAVDRQYPSWVLDQFTTCPFCIKVRSAMHRLAWPIARRDWQNNSADREELQRGSGGTQVPC